MSERISIRNRLCSVPVKIYLDLFYDTDGTVSCKINLYRKRRVSSLRDCQWHRSCHYRALDYIPELHFYKWNSLRFPSCFLSTLSLYFSRARFKASIRCTFQAISHIHIGITILIASHTFVSKTYRDVIKNCLLLFQHGTTFRLYVRTEEDDITFDAGRVISFSPKVKNIVKEEDWKGRESSVCGVTRSLNDAYLFAATPLIFQTLIDIM